jgi:hypothetical protein
MHEPGIVIARAEVGRSSAVEHGAEWEVTIRVTITNHRSRREDFDALMAAVRETGLAATSRDIPGNRTTG